MKEKTFLGLPEKELWLPLTQSLMEASNIIITMSNNDDEKYCRGMIGTAQLLEALYSSVISHKTMMHFVKIFIYCLEFEYGDPYEEGNCKIETQTSVTEYFNKIKNNWDVDTVEAVNEVNRKKSQEK